MTAKDHANPIGCPYCDGKSYGMGPEAREQYKKYHDNGHSWVISHEHVYLCQDCGMSQEEVTDLANTSPNTNTDLSNPQEQRIAEYKQLLNELPPDADTADDVDMGDLPHTLPDYYNNAIDQCRALIEARIKELE